ncbi:MAG: hypothetical protein M9894_10020 [Planctomycetes bacterium]|nr:hypothetical protein [Planctomycetota bacterium]
MRIVQVRPADRPAFQARLAALERLATYPLGDDTFRLDHGADYFAFFDRLGEVVYAAALEGDDVVAVCCGMLRQVPARQGAAAGRAWYLADLKVHPDHRGRRLPLRLLARLFPWNYLRCPRGYGVTMDPPGRAENRVVRLFGRWRWSPSRPAARLLLWSLDRDQMSRAAPLVTARRGPVAFRSLEGVKDLVLGSTGRRLQLLHTEWRATAPGPGVVAAPQADHVHMVCAPDGDPLARDLVGLGLAPDASATVIAHRMADCDWRFIQTSEI